MYEKYFTFLGRLFHPLINNMYLKESDTVKLMVFMKATKSKQAFLIYLI